MIRSTIRNGTRKFWYTRKLHSYTSILASVLASDCDEWKRASVALANLLKFLIPSFPGPHDQEAAADLLGDLPQDPARRQADAGDDPGLRRLQEGPAARQRVHQGVHAQVPLQAQGEKLEYSSEVWTDDVEFTGIRRLLQGQGRI